jgi:prepilin-type N-terminal cleavage/methylation domain-containing protein
MTRRGFTLIELMITLIVTAIVGAAMVRLTMGQARFMSKQEAWRSARSVSRSGVNRLVSDLRVVENGSQAALGGVTAAAAGGQDFTVRVPYAFGIVCNLPSASSVTATLLPVDSAMYAAGGHSGFAVRSAAGVYTYYTSATLNNAPAGGVTANCTAPAAPDLPILAGSGGILPSINGSPTGRVVLLVATANLNPVPPKGSILFLYRRVRYEFKASVAVPGRNGLWRTLLDGGGGATEEIAAPFDNTARVNFYVLNNATAQAAVPANLYDIRGFELVLNGMSERAPEGTTTTPVANVTTSVFFENRPD